MLLRPIWSGRVANAGFGHVDAEAFPALPLGRGEEQTVPAPDVEEPSMVSDDPGHVGERGVYQLVIAFGVARRHAVTCVWKIMDILVGL